MRALLCLASSFILATAAMQRGNSTPVAKLRGYRTWYSVTPQPVDMSPTIAMSCIGPGRLDQAPNPHVSTVFKVFVNAQGKKAMLSKGKDRFPVGSMILKEKYEVPKAEGWGRRKLSKDDKPVLLTAMVKREKGFDSTNGDWEFLVLSGDGKAKSNGSLEHCGACHREQKKTDYVFGNYDSIHHGGFRLDGSGKQ